VTVLDVLMSRVDAFLYVGAILAFLGFLVGVVATLLLTSAARRHGAFHIMLEEEIARDHKFRLEALANARAAQNLADESKASELMHKRWDDIYYDGFAADDEDDEPDFDSWAGNDPWLMVVDASADEISGDEIVGLHYVVPAEAATAVEPEEYECITLELNKQMAEDFAEFVFDKAYGK
jgi:hypothetical protein